MAKKPTKKKENVSRRRDCVYKSKKRETEKRIQQWKQQILTSDRE